jgi:hypothetical protein
MGDGGTVRSREVPVGPILEPSVKERHAGYDRAYDEQR